jgi:cobalt-zinc-cadmium efflux system outer membrane protein
MNVPRCIAAVLVAAGLLSSTPVGHAASLSELMEEARRNNPDILAARRAWQAVAQVPAQVTTLPDPTVSVQHLSVGSPMPFAGYSNSDFAYIGLGISQDLPYPGKLRLKGESAREDVAIARDKLDAVTRSVIEQVKEAYFQIAAIQETLAVLDRDSRLLEQIESIADARYRLGQGIQQDVLKAQLERTKLLREVASQRQLLGSARAQLTKLLDRGANSQDLSSLDFTADRLVETPLQYTTEELLARARTQNPAIAGQQEMVKRQSLGVEMARKDRYPDFNVQYQWQHTADRFRDYYMVSFSARLPIYRSRRLNPELAQATEELSRSEREYEGQIQAAYFEVRDQYLAARTSSQLLTIYREGLIPQALATYQAGLVAYQAGRQDFESLLSSFMDVLNFDREYWKTLAEHETALSRIEQVTGLSLN